jgi:hypothetical protein
MKKRKRAVKHNPSAKRKRSGRRNLGGRKRVNRLSPGLALALDALDGSSVTLARKLDITPQAIAQWDEIPVGRVKEIARITKVSRAKLRPDYFG